MSFIVMKSTPRFEYRIYVETKQTEGKIIYQGHKLGLEKELLAETLDHRIEKSTGKIFFKNYETNQFMIEKSTKLDDNITFSWETLEKALINKFGNFRKISITRYNI